MGEDIHSKILIYSKVEHKYIDGLSLTTYPEYSCFAPMFDGRNYQFFSLFGSQRGDMHELKYGHYGIPRYTPKTYKQYLQSFKSDYYGYRWWKFHDFKKSIEDYIKMLKNPAEYYKDDEYYDELINSGKFNFREYDEEVDNVYRWLKGFRKRLSQIENDVNDFLNQFIDVDKTIFLFYFDC